MLAQDVQITLDFRPDVEQLRALEALSHTPLGQDPQVRKQLTLAASALLSVIRVRAEKQEQVITDTIVSGLTRVIRDVAGGSGSSSGLSGNSANV